MRIRIAPRVGGVPEDGGAPGIPTSKSHAQRAMCLAAFLPFDKRVDGLPESRDVQTLAAALEALRAGDELPEVDLQDNGTALRVLSVLVPMLGMACEIEAGPRLRSRPLQAAREFLARYGATCTEGWPLRVDGVGVAWPEELVVDAGATSQVATGVLLGAAIRLATGDTAHHLVRARSPAAPDYLFVTVDVMSWFGTEVSTWWDDDDLVVDLSGFEVPAADHLVAIPPDPSSYTFYAAFRAIHGLEFTPADRREDRHPDWLFEDDLRRLLEATPNEELSFGEIGRRPDTFPCLVAVAALRCGRTTFSGAPALRHKESDRIHAMAEVLRALGVGFEERPDGLVVEGPMPAHEAPTPVPTPDDHRIVMAVGLLGTRIPGGVEVANPEAVAKSWPDYFDWLAQVAEVTRLD